MSELKLGNQDDKPQDLDKLEINVEGAIEQMVKEANANPSKFAPKSGGSFDLLTEMGAAKVGPVAGAMTTASDMSSGGSDSMFMMSGTGRKSKATKRLESLASSTNAMGLSKTYSEKRDDARQLSRIMAGRGKVSKDPMGGGGDRAIKMAQNKKPLSMQAVRNNPNLAKAVGAGELAETLVATRREKEDMSVTAIVMGALENNQKMVDKINTLNPAIKRNALKQLAGPRPPAGFMGDNKDK